MSASDCLTATRTYRFLMIAKLLRSNGRWTGSAELMLSLSQHGLNPAMRTLQRDMHAMMQCFPIEHDGHQPKGWRWRKDADPEVIAISQAFTPIPAFTGQPEAPSA